MNWEDDQSNYHTFDMVDLSQNQAGPFPLVSPSHDWRLSGDAGPASTSNWNAIPPSHAMPTASEDLHWNTPSSTNAVNAISNTFENPTPSPGLNYSPETRSAFVSYFDRISPGGQSVDLLGQASHEEDACNNELYHRALRPQPHARLQTTNKRTRIFQQYVFSNPLDT